MIVLILIIILLVICTYLLFIGTLNIIPYVIVMLLMIGFLGLKSKYFDSKEIEEEKRKRKQIKKVFPKCDLEDIDSYLFSQYKNILELMNNKEDEKLKQVLNAKLYNKYNSDKEYFKKEHYKNIISDFELVKINVEKTTDDSIELKIDYKCYDYVLNRKNKVIRGDKEEKREYGYHVKFVKNNNKVVLYLNDMLYQK